MNSEPTHESGSPFDFEEDHQAFLRERQERNAAIFEKILTISAKHKVTANPTTYYDYKEAAQAAAQELGPAFLSDEKTKNWIRTRPPTLPEEVRLQIVEKSDPFVILVVLFLTGETFLLRQYGWTNQELRQSLGDKTQVPIYSPEHHEVLRFRNKLEIALYPPDRDLLRGAIPKKKEQY